MSYFDQTGPAEHKYLDTSQPLMPFPSSVTGHAATGSYGPPPGMGSYGPPPGMGSYGPPPGMGTYDVISSQYRGYGAPDLSKIPIAPTMAKAPMPGIYMPPGVVATVSDPASMVILAAIQNTTYLPVNNRICALQPSVGGAGAMLKDIVVAWAKSGYFVVVTNSDPLCPANLVGAGAGGASICAVDAGYIKRLAGTPGWSVLITPGSEPPTKENWDKWLASPPPPPVDVTPVVKPLVAGVSNGAMLLLALVAIGGIVWWMSKPKTSSVYTANRGRKRGKARLKRRKRLARLQRRTWRGIKARFDRLPQFSQSPGYGYPWDLVCICAIDPRLHPRRGSGQVHWVRFRSQRHPAALDAAVHGQGHANRRA